MRHSKSYGRFPLDKRPAFINQVLDFPLRNGVARLCNMRHGGAVMESCFALLYVLCGILTAQRRAVRSLVRNLWHNRGYWGHGNDRLWLRPVQMS